MCGAGKFTFASLPLGAGYSITAVKAGFAPANLANIGIQRGSTAELTIRADAPQLADRIVGRQLEETPLPSRKITYFPLPARSIQFAIKVTI